MYKFVWAMIGFSIFILITFAAVSTENLNRGKRVNFINVNFAVRNSNNKIESKTVQIGGNDVSKTTYVEQKTTPVEQNVVQKKDYKSYTTSSSNTVLKGYKSPTTSKYKNTQADTVRRYEYSDYSSKNTTKYKDNSKDADDVKYAYDNIDWAAWKSNFVNRILDDSVEISELDNYPNGAFFYYSFIVDDKGGISMIKIRSMYLSEHDKKLVENLIRSYAHTSITRFPKNSNRKTASVSAIMMLSSSETVHSKPSDFNDMERVKYQVK
jgi:hypothetical protein